MRALLALLLVLASCSKEEISDCSIRELKREPGNVVTWKGTGPFIVEWVDRLNVPVKMDTVNVPRYVFGAQSLGWVRVRQQCGDWSQRIALEL